MTPLQSPLDYVFPCSLSQFMAARAPPLVAVHVPIDRAPANRLVADHLREDHVPGGHMPVEQPPYGAAAGRRRGGIRQNVVVALGLKGIFMITSIIGLSGLWPARRACRSGSSRRPPW